MENLKAYLVPLGAAADVRRFLFGPATISYSCSVRHGTAQYLASVHMPLPAMAAWVAIIVEIIGGLMILIGFQTRWVALVLAIWCLITGFGVHLPVGDTPNMVHFYKNLVMAGGFLYVLPSAPVGSVDGPGK